MEVAKLDRMVARHLGRGRSAQVIASQIGVPIEDVEASIARLKAAETSPQEPATPDAEKT